MLWKRCNYGGTMFTINSITNDISLTRGDTMTMKIRLTDTNGDLYIPGAGDVIRFAMKKSYHDATPLITQNAVIDGSDITITLQPGATANLEFGAYRYDIQLTTGGGVVDTFVSGTFRITEEVC